MARRECSFGTSDAVAEATAGANRGLDIGQRGAALWSSLPAFRPVALLSITKKPLLDFVVNAVKPILRLERSLLQLIHLGL